MRPGVLLFLILLAGCGVPPDRAPAPAAHRPANPAGLRAMDSLIRMLRNGDIALRAGTDMTSIMLRGMNHRDPRFSHCGIVLLEGGYPFVYHSIGGEDNPDARLRRDSAAAFFAPAGNARFGIARFDLDTAQIRRLRSIAGRHYRAGTLFDLDFDLSSDDRMYCSEFVCKAVQEAVHNRWTFPHSTSLRLEYVSIDNITDPAHARLVCDVPFRP